MGFFEDDRIRHKNRKYNEEAKPSQDDKRKRTPADLKRLEEKAKAFDEGKVSVKDWVALLLYK